MNLKLNSYLLSVANVLEVGSELYIYHFDLTVVISLSLYYRPIDIITSWKFNSKNNHSFQRPLKYSRSTSILIETKPQYIIDILHVQCVQHYPPTQRGLTFATPTLVDPMYGISSWHESRVKLPYLSFLSFGSSTVPCQKYWSVDLY